MKKIFAVKYEFINSRLDRCIRRSLGDVSQSLLEKYLRQKLTNRTYTFYFHNDPLSMSGSKKISDRIYLIKNCYKVIFNSNWSKKRFLKGLTSDFINSEKLIVINQSASKKKINIRY